MRCHGNGLLWGKWKKILRRELLLQFLTETCHRCVPLGVGVQDVFFDRAESALPYGILWAKMGTNLALQASSSVCDQFS